MVEDLQEKKDKIKLENLRVPSDFEIERAYKVYNHFYKWRDFRSTPLIQYGNTDIETVWKNSRLLFWNSLKTSSDDLNELDLDFSLPYVRNEVLQFVGKLVSQDFKGRFNGNNLDVFGVRVLQGIYEKWRFKQNDRVEKFWEVLYGVVNGTVSRFVGYNNGKLTRRFLEGYDKDKGDYKITEREMPYWNDVWDEIVPIEDIYLPKMYERNFQKQGRCIWKTEMQWKDFKVEFKNYDNAEYVYPGNMIAEDSLYYRLLGGSVIFGGDKIQVLKEYDWLEDEYLIYANGVLLNPIGKGKNQTSSPLPWNHKMGPFVWSQALPMDEKNAYGVPLPYIIKEPHKLLNTGITMLWEHELRNVSPAVLSSDFDSPKIVYGKHEVTQVNDVNAYKELKLSEPSTAFFNTLSGMSAMMATTAQGGASDSSTSPSRQPKSSREVLQLQQLKQAAMGIPLILYYNMLRQEMLLVIKTALQFYPADKYAKEQRDIMRAINVPNMPLVNGGVGNLHIRIVPKRGEEFDEGKRNLELFWESINMSLMSGKRTDIIEAPVDVIQNLEFEITDIDLEPAQTDEMRRATFVSDVLTPMFKFYIPAGIADPAKVFLRHLEKMGEHPVDFVNEKVLAQIMQTWKSQNDFKIPPMTEAAPGGNAGGQAGQGGMTGNELQVRTGTQFGEKNVEPIPGNV